MPESQKRILEALNTPAAYPHPVERVVYLQTHISHVFLTGNYAYKLKKPVDLGFVDFRELASRIHFCQEELRLNRRLAPEVYLEVMAVVEGGGGYRLVPWREAGPGDIREACVRMKELDQDRMMNQLLAQGGVTPEHIQALAGILADFYQKADHGPEVAFYGRPEQVRLNVEENFRQTEDYQEVSVAPARWAAVRDYSLAFLLENLDFFERRVAGGYIRDGHGDLHSGNINLPVEGAPVIFDCIEFNERFRFQDTACDLAFLAMDLDFAGQPELSRLLAESYARASGDKGLWELLNFYKCYRAVVRAKIHGFTFDDQAVGMEHKFTDLNKARAYFRLAAQYAGGEPPYFLVCFMGLMGAGKSYLAKMLSRETGWPILASDRVRKQNAGLAPTQRSYDDWGQGLYNADATRLTYDNLLKGAGARLAQGASVIVDASFREDAWRRQFMALAEEHGARPLLVEVRASREVTARRLARREAKGASQSDGRLALFDQQAASWQDTGWLLPSPGLLVDGGAAEEEKMKILMERLAELDYAG